MSDYLYSQQKRLVPILRELGYNAYLRHLDYGIVSVVIRYADFDVSKQYVEIIFHHQYRLGYCNSREWVETQWFYLSENELLECLTHLDLEKSTNDAVTYCKPSFLRPIVTDSTMTENELIEFNEEILSIGGFVEKYKMYGVQGRLTLRDEAQVVWFHNECNLSDRGWEGAYLATGYYPPNMSAIVVARLEYKPIPVMGHGFLEQIRFCGISELKHFLAHITVRNR